MIGQSVYDLLCIAVGVCNLALRGRQEVNSKLAWTIIGRPYLRWGQGKERGGKRKEWSRKEEKKR